MLRLHQLFSIKYIDKYLTNSLKNRSRRILRLWADHCEYIVAQRFRRGQQILCLYRRIWDEQSLKGLVQQFRKQFERHAKGIMFGGVGLASAFDWDSERINYDSVRKNFDELELVKRLRLETIFCESCQKRLIIDCKLDGIVYCTCSIANAASTGATTTTTSAANAFDNPWKPYMERENMIIWRREERSGLYAYKVYAAYDDISAEDFLHVQTDLAYRKEWDKTAISLEIIDTDPVHHNKSHIIYWEMLWPKLFANRDYVFNRRYFIDRNRKLIIIVNKSITHPSSPKKPNNQRVKDYWSCMVIRSTSKSFKTPGLEFVLTYFDNPGVVLPQSVTSWVAQKQLPEFLHKLYIATLEYAQVREQHEIEHRKTCKSRDYFKDPGYEYPPEPELLFRYYKCRSEDNDDDDNDDDDDDDDDEDDAGSGNKRDNKNSSTSNKINTSNNTNGIIRMGMGRNEVTTTVKSTGKSDEYAENQNNKFSDSQGQMMSDENDERIGSKSTSWWRYLLPFHYFV